MGNAQSQSQPQNRLVKPKTHKNSPFLARDSNPNADSPVLPARYVDLSIRERQQVKRQSLPPVQIELGNREPLDDGGHLGDVAPLVQRRHSTRSNSLSCFGSKTGSTTRLSSLPASKVSLVQSSQPVDLEAAISILKEVQRNASPEDVAALQQALQPYASSSSPHTPAVTEHELHYRNPALSSSTSSLTRRRSLAVTPGVATRKSPVELNRRTWNSWKTPELDTQEEAKWQHPEKVSNSRVARIAAMESTQEGRESPIPRAQTPADNEYSHLGSLKPGTLRIANGEPSPGASTILNSASQAEDYFSSTVNDSPITMKATRNRRHIRSKSACQSSIPPLYRSSRTSTEDRRAKTTSQYGTLPKSEARKQPGYEEIAIQLEPEPEPVRRLRVMNKSQDTLARTLDSRTDASQGESDSAQHVPAEDVDEGFVSDDAASFREDAMRILNGSIFGEPVVAEPSSVEIPSTAAINISPITQLETKRRPLPTEADSGYSSSGSLKVKQYGAWKSSTVPSVSKPLAGADLRKSENGSDKSANLYTFEQMLRAPPSPEPSPAAPANGHLASRTLRRFASYEDFKDSRMLETSTPDELSLETPKTPASFISQFSSDRRSSPHKRLQKRRPSFQEPPVVQSCDPIREGSIPDIPTNLKRQFVRRLSETPAMECLTRTYPTKNQVNNEESGPDPPILEPIKLPCPSTTAGPESRGRHHRRAATEQPSSLGGLRRSLSLFRRKRKADREEKQPTLPGELPKLNPGTSPSPPGASPCDSALATAQQEGVSSAIHPDQWRDEMQQKTMVDPNTRTTATSVRQRSTGCASLRPEMAPKPKSYRYYSDKEAMSDAEASRRQNFYGHTPPMPTIPSIKDLGAASTQQEMEKLTVKITEPQASTRSPTKMKPDPGFRARTTGRGRVVTPLIEKYDQFGQRVGEKALQPYTMGNPIAYPVDESKSRSYTMDNTVAYPPPANYSAGRAYSMGMFRTHIISPRPTINMHEHVNPPDWT